jgi:hypothetical protein
MFRVGIYSLVSLWTASLPSTTAEARTAITVDQWIETAVRFVQWPTTSDTSIGGSFVLCHPVGELTSTKLAEREVRGLRFRLMPIANPRETGPCHIFFTESKDRVAIGGWLSMLQHRPVLLLGLSREFCDTGGTICMALASYASARYAVNYAAASAVGLKVSSHLPAHDVNAFSRSGARGRL